MLLIPVLAAAIAGGLIVSVWEARRARRRRFNAIVRSTEHEGEVLYHGVVYEVPDDDEPGPEE